MLPVLHLDRSSPETCPRDTGDPSAGLGQEYQCPSLQFQAIASAASSSRVTISSGSKAIGAHTRLKLAVSQHTRAPNAQLQNIVIRLRGDYLVSPSSPPRRGQPSNRPIGDAWRTFFCPPTTKRFDSFQATARRELLSGEWRQRCASGAVSTIRKNSRFWDTS